MTGIIEAISLEDNIDLARELFPDSDKFVGIVDKTGETTCITIASFMGSEEYAASVTTDKSGQVETYVGLDEVSYKSLTGSYKSMISLPIEKVFETIGIDYTLSYDEEWDIYILEF